jgi:hypothetical protein
MIALQSLLACPVCFGQSDSPMAWAMNTGLLFMLLIVVGVLVGFASFFVHLVRRARLVEASGSAAGADSVEIRGVRL